MFSNSSIIEPSITSGHYFQLGPLVSSSSTSRHFNFGLSQVSTFSGFHHRDNDGNVRMEYGTRIDQNLTYYTLRNNTATDFFKAWYQGTGSVGAFIHMPLANSRFILGANGYYLMNEGHKFIVRNGTSLFEGDLYTNGGIGIGTRSFTDGSDTYLLSVNGKIRAEAVKVYTGWADFVFENDYRLPTLYEVEKYINDNGHLKDIPSAAVVEENGIELGEMNKLLLQKIEELTLYTIEQQKQIDTLKEIILKD